jgi:hypothetical protein
MPSTIIDVSQQSVKQTYLFHEYTVLRKESLAIEIEKIYAMKRKENIWEDLFRPVKIVAPCVQQMIADLYRLPMFLRESFVLQSMKLLIRKAVLLIKYVEAEL